MRAYRARRALLHGLPLRRRGRPRRVASDADTLQRQLVAKDREIAALQARNDELTRQLTLLRETGINQDAVTGGNTGTGIVPGSEGSTGQDGTSTTGTVTDGNTVTGGDTQPDPTTPVLPGTPDVPVTPDGPDDGGDDEDSSGGNDDGGEDGDDDADGGGDDDGDGDDDADGDDDGDDDGGGDEDGDDEDADGDDDDAGDDDDGDSDDDDHDSDGDDGGGGTGGGIGSLRRQRDQAVALVAELRALVEELRLRVTVLEGRSEVLQTQLDRWSALNDSALPTAANAAGARANVLWAIVRRFRRDLRETEAQRDRILGRLIAHGLSIEDSPGHGLLDYGRAQTAFYSQIERELHIRDRHAVWEEANGVRGIERRIDPLRPLATQVLQTTIGLRWLFIAGPPQGFRQRPRWEVEGILLDPQSEQYLIGLSQERIGYRLRKMGVTV